MEVKAFKQDLTYACKKFIKEGKILSAFGDNLSIKEGQFVADGDHLDPLEMFVLVKGYTPTKLMTTTYNSIPHHTVFNFDMVSVVSEQAGIARTDLYSFLDGFENVLGCGNEKTEYYQLGVYIREKFTPFGMRTEALKSVNHAGYKAQDSKAPTRMFVIYSRKNEMSIVEAECYFLTAMDDPAVSFSPPGEFRCLVTAPEILFEKKTNGTIGPAVYHSHSLFIEYEDALRKANDLIEQEFAFKLRKYNVAYSDIDVAAAVLALKLVKLPGSTFLTPAEKVKQLMESTA